MQFNIGLDLNRDDINVKHNALTKAENIMLSDKGDMIITEEGHIPIFDKNLILDSTNLLDYDDSLQVYDRNNSATYRLYQPIQFQYITINGFINLHNNEILLFCIYDTINTNLSNKSDVSIILKYNKITNKFKLYVPYAEFYVSSLRYKSFSFTKNSKIKGTYYYNYLKQLIIAFNDINSTNDIINYTNNISKFKNNYWICNLDNIFINEDNNTNFKYLYQSLPTSYISPDKSTNILLDTGISNGNLTIGSYFLAFLTLDDNNNESEISSFKHCLTVNYNKKTIYYESNPVESRINTEISKYSITVNLKISTKYKLIIAHKNNNNISYYISDILQYSHRVVDLINYIPLGTLNNYLPKLNILNVKAIEQYDNKLLLANYQTLDETYNYKINNVQYNLATELQKVANNIYFTYTPIPFTKQDLSNNYNIAGDITNKNKYFKVDAVYAFYIEFLSKGISLGTYHIPGRETIYISGISEFINDVTMNIISPNGNVIGGWDNNNEYYPDNFPNTSLGINNIYDINYQLTTNNNNILANKKIRHHRILTISTENCDLVKLTARNINIPDQLKSIITDIRIYHAERTIDNNIFIDTILIDTIPSDVIGEKRKFCYSKSLINNKQNITSKAKRKRANITYISDGKDTNWLPLTRNITIPPNISNKTYLDITNNKFTYNDYDNTRYIQQEHFTTDFQPYYNEEYGIYNLYNEVNKDCYFNYANQKLLLCGIIMNLDYYIPIKSIDITGDTFANTDYFGIGFNPNVNGKIYNIRLSNQIFTEYNYGTTNDEALDIAVDPIIKNYRMTSKRNNTFNYNNAFNEINDIWQPIVYTFKNKYTNILPNRIIRTNVNNTESTVIGWKNISADANGNYDYYDLPKNKGEIISMLVDTKRLYVQQEFGLHVTDIKDSLNNQISVLPLDLFDYKPIEINKNNPILSNNPFSLQLTPIGVMVICNTSNIYLIGQDGIKELSQLGIRNYIQPYSNNNNFIQIYNDVLNHRIIITNPNNNNCISYDYFNNCFVSTHTYLPQFGITINNELLLFNTNGLYKYDKSGTTFLDNNILKESKIDIVYNSNQEINKLLQSISWRTKSINQDGSENDLDTFKRLMIYNNTQCSNYIDLKNIPSGTNQTYDWFDTIRTLKKYDNFYFNEFSDKVNFNNTNFLDQNKEPINSNFGNKDWYNLSSFINNYFVIRFTYNGLNKLLISDITPTIIKNQR
jgi:hypothetical protein